MAVRLRAGPDPVPLRRPAGEHAAAGARRPVPDQPGSPRRGRRQEGRLQPLVRPLRRRRRGVLPRGVAAAPVTDPHRRHVRPRGDRGAPRFCRVRSAMTVVEDRVREALADLAPTVPADGAARVGVARAVGRRRRRGVAGRVIATAVVGGVLAGVAITGPPALRRDRAVVPATSVTTVTVPPPTPVPPPTTATVSPPETDAPAESVVPATTVPSTATGERVAFAGVHFVLPQGWVIADQRGDETICVEPEAPDPY